jgi:hypothetical protein
MRATSFLENMTHMIIFHDAGFQALVIRTLLYPRKLFLIEYSCLWLSYDSTSRGQKDLSL